jgi:hypothetical protein
MDNYFTELYSISVKDKIEKKNGLSYLSWALAWAELKKKHPNAYYTIYERADGRIYWDDGKTAWVKTGVTVPIKPFAYGIEQQGAERNIKTHMEHIEYLPIMDLYNKSIPIDNITSVNVNKAIQRSLTKASARHGLGLYIYAGEDLPEVDNNINEKVILIDELILSGVDIDKVCEYYKKESQLDLTIEDLKDAIAKKKGCAKWQATQ